MSIELKHEGQLYFLKNEHWVDSRSIVVPQYLQMELSSLYAKTLDLTSLSFSQIIEYADKFNKNQSHLLAIHYYEYAANLCDKGQIAYILPRITSCYRKIGKPQKVIDILSYASNKFGKDVVSFALLTSAAAAYCDIGDYDNALKCCKRAYASGAKGSEEISLVYKRIKKEKPELFE